jgi:hypothetical protein
LNPCDTFTISQAGVPGWLWVVVCKDASRTILIVDILPADHKRFDATCIIAPADHEPINRDSFVDYEMARIVSLEKQRALARFIVLKTAMSVIVIDRIRDGWLAGHGYDEHRRFLRNAIADE